MLMLTTAKFGDQNLVMSHSLSEYGFTVVMPVAPVGVGLLVAVGELAEPAEAVPEDEPASGGDSCDHEVDFKVCANM